MFGDTFAFNPCVENEEIPDPPLGRKSPSESADFYRGGGEDTAFSCPLQLMTIRNNLVAIAEGLNDLNNLMLDQFFGNGS